MCLVMVLLCPHIRGGCIPLPDGPRRGKDHSIRSEREKRDNLRKIPQMFDFPIFFLRTSEWLTGFVFWSSFWAIHPPRSVALHTTCTKAQLINFVVRACLRRSGGEVGVTGAP